LPDYWKKVVFAGGLTGAKHKGHTVIFLPPNTTSVIQPLDQGTIMGQVMVWTREAKKHPWQINIQLLPKVENTTGCSSSRDTSPLLGSKSEAHNEGGIR